MKFLIYVVAVVTLCTCSPTVTVTSSWKNTQELAATTKTYKSVFITAMTPNVTAKSIVETALADAAKKGGYTVHKSIDMFPGDLSSIPDKNIVLDKIKALGCDAIFTAALVNKEAETRYVPGSSGTMYQPYPTYGYYGSYWGYNTYMYQTMYSSPGYYTTDKTYFLESNIFDVQTEKLLWSAQSKAVNPADLKSFSEKYTAAIVRKIRDDKVFKK